MFGDFVDKPDATIRVIVYPLRFLSGHEIVKRAIDWANGRFQPGELEALKKLPKHFSRLCTINYKQADSVEKVIDFVRLVKMDILPVENLL